MIKYIINCCKYASNISVVVYKVQIEVLNVSISQKKYHSRRFNFIMLTNIKNV